MKSMRSLYKKLFHYVPDKRILAYFSMALSAAAVCSYMGAYWFLWQSIVSILVIPVYEKAMYDAIIVVILMILRGILNIASATCSHYLGFRLETNLRKNGRHKLLDASSSFFDHNSSGEIRKIIDDNAAETHKTVAHLIPDNVTAVMTPVLMFVLMFAIDYRLGILLILTTVIGVLQYRKMSGGTEFLSGYSAALQKMSAATVEYGSVSYQVQVGGAFYYLHLPWRFPVRVHSSELCVPLFWLNYLLIMFGLQKPVDYLPTEFWYATFCEMPYRLLLQFSFSNSAF